MGGHVPFLCALQTEFVLCLVYKRFYQPVNLFWPIRIGVMPRAFYPLDRYPGFFVPCLIVPDTRTSMIFFPTDKKGWALDLIRKIGLHCLCQHFEPMSRQFCIPCFITVVDHHDLVHQFPSVFRHGDTVRPCFQKRLPRIIPIDRLHSFQKPYLHSRHIGPLERCRINGNKAPQLFWKQLCIGLTHITAHRLTDNDWCPHILPYQNPIQPPRLILKAKRKAKWPRGCMTWRVPHKNRTLPLKVFNLFVE